MKSSYLVQVQALARRPRVLKNVIIVVVPPKITGPRSSKDISITSLARVFSCVSFARCARIAYRLSRDHRKSHVFVGVL